MSTRIFERPLLALGLSAALLAGAIACLRQGEAAQRAWRAFAPPLSRAVPADLSRVGLLAALAGQARLAADWAYIDCLQYTGDLANEQDGRYRRSAALYTEVAWLDPGFRYAVREGVSLLGWFLRRPKEAQALAETAWRWDRGEPRYAAYIAALAYQAKLDPANVVEALREEVRRPDAPEMLLRMVGNVYLKAEDWEGARTYWSWLLQRSQDPITRRQGLKALELAGAGLSKKAPHGR